MKIYKRFIKPVLFKIDPERVHDTAVFLGKILGDFPISRAVFKKIFHFEHNSLRQNILGMDFKNPFGLAAGFDKNAELIQTMHSIGFGHVEVGSVTARPCPGNKKPRLWRMPEHRSLIVYYGLKNKGVKVISNKIKNKKFKFPLGISIAKTNCQETVDVQRGTADYIEGIKVMAPYSNFITINISCPNAYGGEQFNEPRLLNLLLEESNKLKLSKPIFLKISPDITLEKIDKIIDICDRHKVGGFVISNLVKDRAKVNYVDFSKVGKGGISGKVTQKYADELISHVYGKVGRNYVIVGCGGVFCAKDAYEKIKRGASLIQLITGMIYEGPFLIKKMKKDLVKLLRADGYNSVSEAVGAYHK